MSELMSWSDLEQEVESLFNNPLYKTRSSSPLGLNTNIAYPIILDIINEIKNNVDKYIEEPTELSKFIFENENYAKNMGHWLPYLSGGVAKLLKMRFFDENKEEITDLSKIREIIGSDDKEIKEKTIVYICTETETLIKFNTPKEKMKPR